MSWDDKLESSSCHSHSQPCTLQFPDVIICHARVWWHHQTLTQCRILILRSWVWQRPKITTHRDGWRLDYFIDLSTRASISLVAAPERVTGCLFEDEVKYVTALRRTEDGRFSFRWQRWNTSMGQRATARRRVGITCDGEVKAVVNRRQNCSTSLCLIRWAVRGFPLAFASRRVRMALGPRRPHAGLASTRDVFSSRFWSLSVVSVCSSSFFLTMSSADFLRSCYMVPPSWDVTWTLRTICSTDVVWSFAFFTLRPYVLRYRGQCLHIGGLLDSVPRLYSLELLLKICLLDFVSRVTFASVSRRRCLVASASVGDIPRPVRVFVSPTIIISRNAYMIRE